MKTERKCHHCPEKKVRIKLILIAMPLGPNGKHLTSKARQVSSLCCGKVNCGHAVVAQMQKDVESILPKNHRVPKTPGDQSNI